MIREVYGLSEASGPSIITQEGATLYGSVGFPFPGIEAGLAEDDEIVLRGRSVFAGYLNKPEATRHALRDGWLYTGDLGSIGSDGLFTITGRKKDIVITTGGKNICPQPIEELLRQDPIIVDAVIVGDGYDQLGVLVWVVDGPDDEAALEQIERRVQAVNQRFARAEQIRKIALLPRPLSVDEGERLAGQSQVVGFQLAGGKAHLDVGGVGTEWIELHEQLGGHGEHPLVQGERPLCVGWEAIDVSGEGEGAGDHDTARGTGCCEHVGACE